MSSPATVTDHALVLVDNEALEFVHAYLKQQPHKIRLGGLPQLSEILPMSGPLGTLTAPSGAVLALVSKQGLEHLRRYVRDHVRFLEAEGLRTKQARTPQAALELQAKEIRLVPARDLQVRIDVTSTVQ